MKQYVCITKPYRALIVILAFLVSACSSVSTEVAYVFTPAQAVENPFPKDTMCPGEASKYKGSVPAYFALYQPSDDLKAYVRLVPTEHNIHTVGPGVMAPLPVIPEPIGNLKTTAYTFHPEAQIKKVKVAIYPAPFKKGYFFTPNQVQLEIGGRKLYPEKITKHYSDGHTLQKQEKGIAREKLKWQSTEYLAYLLEFNVDNIASASGVLHVKGFDVEGKAVSGKNFELNVNESILMDWLYDVDCN